MKVDWRALGQHIARLRPADAHDDAPVALVGNGRNAFQQSFQLPVKRALAPIVRNDKVLIGARPLNVASGKRLKRG